MRGGPRLVGKERKGSGGVAIISSSETVSGEAFGRRRKVWPTARWPAAHSQEQKTDACFADGFWWCVLLDR